MALFAVNGLLEADEFHVQKRQAHLVVLGVFGELGLLNVEGDGVAVRRGLKGTRYISSGEEDAEKPASERCISAAKSISLA